MSISQPPNPFIGYTNEQFAFVGTATDASGKDVTADCDWVWYFTKGKGVTGDPVLHAFAKAGAVTVTATAHLEGDSGAATITGTISPAPLAAMMVIEPFMYLKLPDGTRVDPGASVCDMCEVYMEIPPLYVCNGFETKPSSAPSWTWQAVSATFAYQIQHDGVTWSVYKSTGWSTWGEKNWGVDWRASWTKPKFPPPPETGYATGTWTLFNTVVTSGGGVILFDPDDPALDEATIPWSISHMDYRPVFDVTVSAMTVTGTVVRTLTATAGLGAGSVIWDGSTNAGPTATKGVYTYQVSARHRYCEPPNQLCSDVAFADLGVQGGLPGFELHADLDQVKLKTGYSLSRAVGSCWLDVYDPALTVCHSASGLVTSAGTYESDWMWKPAVSGPPHTYTNVIYTVQTATEGLENRDQQPKPGLRRGGGETYAVLAVGFRDPSCLAGWGDVATDLAAAGYAASLSDHPAGSVTSALEALDHAAILTSVGHGVSLEDPTRTQALMDTVPASAALVDYEGATTGDPSWYDADRNLNTDEYEGCWQQLRFVLLVHCYSGRVSGEHSDLLKGIVGAGAGCAVGFVDWVYDDSMSYLFVTRFWWNACLTGSIGDALDEGLDAVWEWCAANNFDYDESGYDSCRWYGDLDTPLLPPRYGW